MWNLFGIDEDNVECEHPVDLNRLLLYASDFPHLVKTMWPSVLKQKILKVF